MKQLPRDEGANLIRRRPPPSGTADPEVAEAIRCRRGLVTFIEQDRRSASRPGPDGSPPAVGSGRVQTPLCSDRVGPLSRSAVPTRAATRGTGVDPDVLEGIVFLESGGRPDALASNDLHGAAGLTQILAQTGTNLLGMKIDVAASTRLTKLINRGRKVAARTALRRRVDERFDPAKSLAATVRYLQLARRELGNSELATVSYHMGIGNLQTALKKYGQGTVPYVQLYFDTSPIHHASAYAFLAGLGDDSSTYLWRVRAAELIMRRYERASTILTSNLDFEEWGDAFPDNRILGAATLDRLRHGAYRLVFKGPSQRNPRPMPISAENTVAKNSKKPQS